MWKVVMVRVVCAVSPSYLPVVTSRTMPYEMTRTRAGDSGERQPAISPPSTFSLLPTISPLPAISLLPESNEARLPPSHTTPVRALLTPQRAFSSYKPTPASIVPVQEADVQTLRPSRWTVVRRKLNRYLTCDCYALKNCMSCSQTCFIVTIVIVSTLSIELYSVVRSARFCRFISDCKWLTGSGCTTSSKLHWTQIQSASSTVRG